MPEYIAKQAHHSNYLKRAVKAGEPVEIPDLEAESNPLLYEPRVARSGGKMTLEELIDKALQKGLGKEEDIKRMPYNDLYRLVKERG
jgi:hypothetical protein